MILSNKIGRIGNNMLIIMRGKSQDSDKMQKKQRLKRVFDVTAASIGVVVFAPVMVATAGVMSVANRSAPLFFQERLGKDEKPFTIFKIKTMKDTKDEHGNPLPDAQRTSKIGIIIRKSRLDELPQLFNVIKGDMSLVGPRPLMHGEISRDPVRNSVRPGITGPSQIEASKSPSEKKAIARDREYAQKISSQSGLKSLFTDLGIIAATPKGILARRKLSVLKKPKPQ